MYLTLKGKDTHGGECDRFTGLRHTQRIPAEHLVALMAFEYSFRRPDCSHLRKLSATTLQLSEVTQQAMLNKLV